MTRLPNFIYIGPDKAGSSWLHDVLIAHPQVFMTPAKDLYFFDRYFDKGLDWYAAHFEKATDELVVGEVCQDYLFHPEAAERIRGVLTDPRFMVTLRDPVDRAFSSYLYMLKMGQQPGTFAAALRSRPELLDHGRYGSGLDRFADRFGDESLYVAVFDDLAGRPTRRSSPDCSVWLRRRAVRADRRAPRHPIAGEQGPIDFGGTMGACGGGLDPRTQRRRNRREGQTCAGRAQAALSTPQGEAADVVRRRELHPLSARRRNGECREAVRCQPSGALGLGGGLTQRGCGRPRPTVLR